MAWQGRHAHKPEFDPKIHMLKGENQIIQLVFSVWRISHTKTCILTLFSVSYLIFAISETNTVMLFFSPSDLFRKIRESELFVLSIFLHNSPLENFFLEFALSYTHLTYRERKAVLETGKVITGAMEKANNLSHVNSSALYLTSL